MKEQRAEKCTKEEKRDNLTSHKKIHSMLCTSHFCTCTALMPMHINKGAPQKERYTLIKTLLIVPVQVKYFNTTQNTTEEQ